MVRALLLFAFFPHAANAAPITIDDLFRMTTIANARISPDGEAILYAFIEPRSDGSLWQSVWKADLRDGAMRKLTERGGNPRWSPDGARFAWTADRQLWVARPDGSDPRKLGELAGGVDDFAWSPDGTKIAAISPVRRAAQIHLLDLRGGLRQLTNVSFTLAVSPWDPDANLSWSPDGKEIAFAGKPSPKFDDDYRTDLYAATVATGEIRQITNRDGMDTRPMWSPDGKSIAFRSSFGNIDRYANHGIAVVAARGGAPRDIGREFEGGFLDGPYWHDWSADSGTIYFLGRHRAGTQMFALDPESGAVKELAPRDHAYSRPSLARAKGRIALLHSTVEMPWEIFTVDLPRFEPRRITNTNVHLRSREMPSARIISWKAGDGRDVEGVLILPHGFQTGTRLPTIVRLHGGPEGTNMPAFAPELPFPDPSLETYPHSLYAARGYATLMPNFRGSGGYGEGFRRAAQIEWSEGFFDDVMKGVDVLVEQGIADSDRIVIGGYWRSGATKVVSIIGRTQRFKAATILSAYPNFVELYHARDDFHLQHEGLMGGSPTAAPDAYRKHEPIHRLTEIRTPAMVVHDERDFAIRSTQAMAIHKALLEKNVPGELVLYRGLDRHAEAELIRRLLAFYDRWIRPLSRARRDD